MEKEEYLKALTGKDEAKAMDAALYLVNTADVELYRMLVDKSDYLFDFIRNNICKRIEKAVSKDNFKNIIKFFDIYCIYYDELFANILAKHANQDLTDDIFELLEKGTNAQKAYAAKYFYYIPDTVALEPLSKYAFSDDEALSYNAAEALGQMRDDISYDIALNNLESDDDFEKLKSVKFFCAYGQKFPFQDIFNAMNTSKMPENIAGQIPYMESLVSLLNSKYKSEALNTIDYILSGLGEILPLADIFQFELYEVINILINENNKQNEYSGKIAEILLNAYSKFNMFCENQEYVFDEDKDTKYEISAVWKLLQSQNSEFWNKQKEYIAAELSSDSKNRILSALHVISEFNISLLVPQIKALLQSNDEIILCEALTSLKQLNSLDSQDIETTLNRIQNPNIKAIIENLKL
ncbi:HEAT repeat domain-containing protein [bacterium]|nr:HEAT repeat domain-containing protein [bacterium]